MERRRKNRGESERCSASGIGCLNSHQGCLASWATSVRDVTVRERQIREIPRVRRLERLLLATTDESVSKQFKAEEGRMTVDVRTQVQATPRRGPGRPRRVHPVSGAPGDRSGMMVSAIPPIVTVHRGANGGIVHTRCARQIEFVGVRGGGVEVDFYCLACREHVTLTEAALSRIPLGRGVAG